MKDFIRLQKYLADAGVCSRRKAEELIRAGRVDADGISPAPLGTKVHPGKCRVLVDGKPVMRPRGSYTTILLNKPRGYITSTAEGQGRTVYELVPAFSPRLLPVGRLDKDSEGALLMTNCNELISFLTHPRYQHEKHYQVTISGKWTREILRTLNAPMVIDGFTLTAVVEHLRLSTEDRTRHVLHFVLTGGKNRQIRRMCEASGLKVHRLVRTHFAGISIKGVRPGQWRKLTDAELASLSQ